MTRLDNYDNMPSGMREYLGAYGWHFSKKMCDWAVSCMMVSDPAAPGKKKRLEPWTKQEVDDMLRRNGVTIENDKGYDCVYVTNMLKADFYKKSLADEAHLCQHVKLYMDDVDGYDGLPLTRFLADCIGKGEPIIWYEMM